MGDGKSIYVWRDAWVHDLPGFRVGTTPASDLVNLKVSDLLLDAGRGWDSELVHSIFENNDSRAICSIPLSKSQTSDSLIWHYSNSGLYTVKSCYRMMTVSLHETESRSYVSSWKKLWKLFLPSKIISFLWRLCNSCIPVSVRLFDKGMNLSTCCVLCGQRQEHYWHLFYNCPYSSSCWTVANVVKPTLTTDEFPVWLLKLIDDLDPVVMCLIAMILWCVWRQRNQKLWENSSLSTVKAMELGYVFLQAWRRASAGAPSSAIQCTHGPLTWSRPLGGRWKCNLDASMFRDLSAIGMGMVMRRNDGQFYACKTLLMPLSCSVKEAEALALREALLWALSLKLVDVEFETNSLLVVNGLSSHSLDCSEYGFIISDWVCLRGNGNYSIRFVKRQANKCAHVLARHSCFNASLYESFVIPSWLEKVVISDLSFI